MKNCLQIIFLLLLGLLQSSHGTPTEMYQDDGTLFWERELNANGKILKETQQGICPILFQGQYYDAEIELAYNRFRYYDPEDGRYISQDPIGLASGEPNFYAYVADTNTWIDPFGLECGKNAKALRENLKREGRNVGAGQAAGHIVASTGSKGHFVPAVKSRELLDKYKIGINDAANGIPINHPTPHNVMHVGDFHTNVRDRLFNVESKMIEQGYGRNAIRSALRKELRKIGNETLNSL